MIRLCFYLFGEAGTKLPAAGDTILPEITDEAGVFMKNGWCFFVGKNISETHRIHGAGIYMLTLGV